MKWILFALIFSGQLIASEAPGKIFYKSKDGTLAEREVTLEVPSRGQGEVILRGEKIEWKSKNFHHMDEHGRKVFVVDFDVERNGKKKVISFRGTYMRTEDRVLYYGDLFKVKKCDGHKPPQDPPHDDELTDHEFHPPRHGHKPPRRGHRPPRRGHKPPRHGDGPGHQKHIGGFYFTMDR